MADPSHPVSFRLPHDKAQCLERLARAEGLSCGEMARRLVLSAMAGDDVRGGDEQHQNQLVAAVKEIRADQMKAMASISDLATALTKRERRPGRCAPDATNLPAVTKILTLLREDLATMTLALLVEAGKASAEEAQEWVDRNLRKAR